MTISQSLQGDLETLTRACRVLDMEEHTDLTQGHLSMRDPVGRGVWMKRRGISLRQVRSLDDMVLISWEGELLDGDGPMHLEWPIHTEIMLARPDINAVGHTHPFHASIFSATNETLCAVVQGTARVLGGRVARYDLRTDLINTCETGAGLAESLGGEWAVFMKNHGLTFCGPSVEGATLNAIHIERACKAQLFAASTGLAWDACSEEELVERSNARQMDWLIKASWGFFSDKLDRLEAE